MGFKNYAEWFGQKNKVKNTGIIPYVGDGTDFFPLAGTTEGVPVPGTLKQVSVTKALVASAGYDINDVLSESAGSGTSWLFAAIAREDGASGYITKAEIISQSEGVVPRITLFVFSAVPTSELDDNAANTAPDSADLANYIGRIDVTALESLGTTDSNAVATPSTVGNLPLAFKCASDADDLFVVAVTRDAFTQTAGENLTIRLTAELF